MGIKVVGISFHVGSGCRDPTAFGVAIAHAARLFEFGRQTVGHDMTVLDVGGGFPGFASEEIDFPTIANVINDALETYFPEEANQNVEIIAEPGRFYASAAFTLCCSVIAKTRVSAQKVTGQEAHEGEDGMMYYLNDGVYGSFNCILYDHFTPSGRKLTTKETERASAQEELWSSVWGPTCDGLDQIAEQMRLPRMEEGDWMIWENMGAYTASAGSEFNGFPRPNIHYFVTETISELISECGSDGGRSRVGSEVSDKESLCSSTYSNGADDSEQEQ
jgi:diaminopimelate decarboxylase